MGLDVYLYKHDDYEKEKALNEKYAAESDVIWKELCGGSYNDMPEDSKEIYSSKSKNLRLQLGLNEKYQIEGTECIEINSKLYPDHYFKIGYFRSSYNSGGINQVLGKLMDKDLYYIFNPPEEEYAFKPNWQNTLKICNYMIEELKALLQRLGKYKVTFFYDEFWKTQVDSERGALEIFLQEIQGKNKSDFNYSCKSGEFFIASPMRVVAVIQGSQIGNKKKGAYVIYEDEEGYEWYLHALEIVKETIEYVLTQPDIDKYYLHWGA